MSVTGNDPTANDRAEHAEDALRVAGWRHEHEVRSLRDTLSLYRDWASTMAAENEALREELAELLIHTPRLQAKPAIRSRNRCRA
jgi:hypothetical protein